MRHASFDRGQMFPHEKLHVYDRALEFVARASNWVAGWDKKHAVSDQLSSASDSLDESLTGVMLNIAEGNGRYSHLDHRRFLDIAGGCAVKGATYLNLAVQKGILSRQQCRPGKDLLGRTLMMLSRM